MSRSNKILLVFALPSLIPIALLFLPVVVIFFLVKESPHHEVDATLLMLAMLSSEMIWVTSLLLAIAYYCV